LFAVFWLIFFFGCIMLVLFAIVDFLYWLLQVFIRSSSSSSSSSSLLVTFMFVFICCCW
jgi:hypothetical protein